ncbi:hypothetical protein [Staphylospora marina]|uniref:hypothetical protein n=1 Tax=Staphylospora marina TaxID=2490858 RepID=UPI000F5BE2CA|nr:hypothetical protein [Staphylospora marina]
MPAAPASGWILDLLQAHLSPEELQRVRPILLAETWTSPSARHRSWMNEHADIPLRFDLKIDIKG